MEWRSQYTTDGNLSARQRLWAISRHEPEFDLIPWVLARAELDGSERVLDVGCGNGAYLERVEAVGMDLSFGMLEAARGRVGTPLVRGNAERLPFADESFDRVLAPHMLYHVADRQAAARELRRVLEPGGTCIAVTNGRGNLLEMLQLVEAVVGHGWRWRRPDSFSLENGFEQLEASFERVERVDSPPGFVAVTDVDAFAAYLASVGEEYGPEVAAWTTWDAVVEECSRRAAEVIAEKGAFRCSKSVGAFVCR